jgi:hypothetical protein
LQRVKRQLNSSTLNEAGLNMTATPGMRDLAHRLLTYEAGADKTSEPMESPTVRVYEKLRQCLGEFVGTTGFHSLASRALTLSRTETPTLCAARIAADGSLQGLGNIETQFEIDNDPAGDGGIILIARLLGLLRLFLGEALTQSLLRNAWPGEVFDDRNLEHGRRA